MSLFSAFVFCVADWAGYDKFGTWGDPAELSEMVWRCPMYAVMGFALITLWPWRGFD